MRTRKNTAGFPILEHTTNEQFVQVKRKNLSTIKPLFSESERSTTKLKGVARGHAAASSRAC